MKLALVCLTVIFGLSLADELWNDFRDWDDDSIFRGYRPTGFLRGGTRGLTRYPKYRGINRGNFGLNGGLSNSGYGGYSSFGRSFGSSYTTGGTLGAPRHSVRPNRKYHYHNKGSFIRPGAGLGGSLGILSDDNDLDDENIGILGRTANQVRISGGALRPGIKHNHNKISSVRPKPSPIHLDDLDNDLDDFDDGIRGPVAITNGGGRAAIKPIDNKTYRKKISTLPSGIGGPAVLLPKSLDDDNDFDDLNGVIGRPSVLPAIRPQIGLRGGAVNGATGGVLRPSFDDDIDDDNIGIIGSGPGGIIGGKGHRNKGIHGGKILGGNLGRPVVGNFDQDEDDFNRGILAPAVGVIPGGRKVGGHNSHYKPLHRPMKGHTGISNAYKHYHNDDDFGSAPIFGAVAGYGNYPYHNYQHYNSYMNGYHSGGSGILGGRNFIGGVGGFGGGLAGGFGGRLGGRFGGRFGGRRLGRRRRHGGGSGGASGGASAESYESNESGGSGGGFGRGGGRFGGRFRGAGGRFGGVARGGFGGLVGGGFVGLAGSGVAGRFVGGGFGPIGGIKGHHGGHRYGTYRQSYKKWSY